LAAELARRHWSLVIDARNRHRLDLAAGQLRGLTQVEAIAGDVAAAGHRAELIHAAERLGGLDLLVNNASTLGTTPLPSLDRLPLEELRAIMEINVLAPLALIQLALPLLGQRAIVLNISSDAAVEPYPGWGGYGASKAALDQLTAVLAAEHPDRRFYALDPGDMRTEMHQAAFPGEDISDRPEPATVVPAILALLDRRPASGRRRAADLLPMATPTTVQGPARQGITAP
jgi:NAD(P)-dependent dehydrogenase (short-subunit alcohol dehydrogenase family)